MNVAQHAEHILTAWKQADASRFSLELDNALRSCQRSAPADYFEIEQREVLISVAERLRIDCSPQSLHAGFSLLEHLRHRSLV